MAPPVPPKDVVETVVERMRQSKSGGSSGSNKNNNSNSNSRSDGVVLAQQISLQTIEETQNSLRVLNVQHRLSTLGKGDNVFKRACALLEYNAREIQGLKLPMRLLAKIAKATSPSEFEKFHTKIGNLRRRRRSTTSTTTSRKSMNTSHNDNDGSKTKTTRATVQASTEDTILAIQKSSSLPLLAIKLATYVADSNGVAQRAQNVLNQLMKRKVPATKTTLAAYANASTSFAAANREYQQLIKDIQTHQAAYEAVCFYIIAKQEMKQQQLKHSSSKTSSSAGQYLFEQQHHQSQSSQHQQQQPLTVETMLQFTTDFTAKEFRTIHEFVSMNAKHILSNSKSVVETTATSKRGEKSKGKVPHNQKTTSKANTKTGTSATSGTKRRDGGVADTAPKGKRSKASKKMTTSDDVNDDSVAIDNNDDYYYNNNDNESKYSYEFLNWKEKTLAKTMMMNRTKDKIIANETTHQNNNNKEDVSLLPPDLSWDDKNKESLHQVARQILRRRGLLK